MFISVKHLESKMGVDEQLARFFVDRKVPEGNAFWNKRRLYVNRGNGYISIPVYYDLLHRIGISKQDLLEETHIHLMEQIMHFAIQVEWGQISFDAQLVLIQQLLEGRIRNLDFYNELLDYLKQPILKPKGKLGMPVPALNRADVFLFILCDLPITPVQIEKAIPCWYAMHTTYLLMDDIYDYQLDKQNLEENAIIELGDGKEGSAKAFDILESNAGLLREINPVLGDFFQEAFDDLKKLTP